MNKLPALHNHACRKYKGFYPNITPVIYNLSQYTSPQGDYALVYITGNNYLLDGMTRVNFGSYILPVTFFNSVTLSFIVPADAPAGVYSVRVTTVDNTQVVPSTMYSNGVNYTIT
jgi:hypothetical protein